MANWERTRIITHDMRRATVVLEKAAGDAGDYFLQYLYGMAILHLEHRAGITHPREHQLPLGDRDPLIATLAKRLRGKTTPKVAVTLQLGDWLNSGALPMLGGY